MDLLGLVGNGGLRLDHFIGGRAEAACRPVRSPERPSNDVDWNAATLFLLAAFGILSLAITQLIVLVKQLPELVEALRKLRDSFRGSGGGTP
ncbi:hypothetical protein [Kitasatospora sp. NPDC088779]|uniref:hypothetical protein n=1 Tax=Kitasatospora sp. NPDC088779 TaxID=3154964 RepID=UPI00342DD7FE